MNAPEALFWAALGSLMYIYAGFPLVLLLRSRLVARPVRAADHTPSVSVIIAAYNEGAGIAARLENVLASDYPRHLLEVVVASDGSTDGTEAVVRRFAARGVQLVRLPRRGKAAAIDAAVAASRGEILVFTDANTAFAPHAIRHLVRPLADPSVGGVAGDQRYVRSGHSRGMPGGRRPLRQGTLAADWSPASDVGERRYWDFDRLLKRCQSAAGSCTSATGAIYGLRRALFRSVPPGVTDDFANSTAVVAQGYRLVFEPTAVAYERLAGTRSAEFRRKVRIMTRGLRGVVLSRQLLNPRRHGFYAVQLLSHKVLRRLAVIPLAALLLSSAAVRSGGWFFAALLELQLAFYTCALLGLVVDKWWPATLMGPAWWARLARALALPAYFVLANAAAVVAMANLVSGRRIDTWQPQRPPPEAGRPDAGGDLVGSYLTMGWEQRPSVVERRDEVWP
jgi:cellulose synthase/poly-beta-1,6-N-acetylglucosamine synthase-like glycosyltransferase